MKVAIIHDSIFEFGGAERVVLSLLKIFPKADLYTIGANYKLIEAYSSVFCSKNVHILLNKSIFCKGSILQLFSPFLWKRLNLDSYNLVISSSSFLMSNLVRTANSIHIQYIHTYAKNIYGDFSKNRLQKIFEYSNFIKPLYYRAIHSTPFVITNSKYMQELLNKKFQISSKVLYPPVFVPKQLVKKKRGKYFLSVSRISPTKHIELIIQVCNHMKLPLKIVGMGNDLEYQKKLISIAGSHIEFLGFRSDEELKALYQSAIALICASGKEDFGISSVEAQAFGVPVVAYNDGGFRETVINNKTGILYNNLSVKALKTALYKVQLLNFNSKELYVNAKKYSENKFILNMKSYVHELLNNVKHNPIS